MLTPRDLRANGSSERPTSVRQSVTLAIVVCSLAIVGCEQHVASGTRSHVSLTGRAYFAVGEDKSITLTEEDAQMLVGDPIVLSRDVGNPIVSRSNPIVSRSNPIVLSKDAGKWYDKHFPVPPELAFIEGPEITIRWDRRKDGLSFQNVRVTGKPADVTWQDELHMSEITAKGLEVSFDADLNVDANCKVGEYWVAVLLPNVPSSAARWNADVRSDAGVGTGSGPPLPAPEGIIRLGSFHVDGDADTVAFQFRTAFQTVKNAARWFLLRYAP